MEKILSRLHDFMSDLDDDKQRQLGYDLTEELREELEKLKEEHETAIDELNSEMDKMAPIDDDKEDLFYTVEGLKSSYERLSLGVLSEIENIIETTNKIIEFHY